MKNLSRLFAAVACLQAIAMFALWPQMASGNTPPATVYQNARFLCGIGGASPVSFNLNTDTIGQASYQAQNGPNYGCLGSTPVRPHWFRFQAANTATLRMIPQPTSNANLNFVLYGPFQNPNPVLSDLNSTTVLACSNSPALLDTLVANVVQNRYYILFISNQEGYAGTFSFRPAVGNGAIFTSTISSAITNPLTIAQCSPAFSISTWPSSADITGLTFSGPGVNPSTGSFDPDIAGVGTHLITISGNPYGCGVTSATYSISVTNCPTVPVISATDTLCWNSPVPSFAVTPLDPALLPSGVTVSQYEWQNLVGGLWQTTNSGPNPGQPAPRNLFQGNHVFRLVAVRSDGVRVRSNAENIFVLDPPQQPFITAASGNGSAGNNGTLTLTACQGSDIQFTYTLANGGGRNTFRYQWQRRDVRGGLWSNVGLPEVISYSTGSRTKTFVGFTDQSYLYRIQATDVSPFLCGSVFSDSILVLVASTANTINPGTISVSSPLCLSNGTNITATSPSGSIFMPNSQPNLNCGRFIFQWQVSNDNTNWSNISGATNATYSVPARSDVSTRWYRRNCTYVLDGSCTVPTGIGTSISVTLSGTQCPATPVSSNSVSVSWVDDLPFVSAKRTQTMTGPFNHPWSTSNGVNNTSSNGFTATTASGTSGSAFYRLSQGIVPADGIVKFNVAVEYSSNNGSTWASTAFNPGSINATFELPGSPGSFSITSSGEYQARVFAGNSIGFNISYSGTLSASNRMRIRVTSFSYHPRGEDNADTLCAGLTYTTDGSAVALHPVASSVIWSHNGFGTLSTTTSAVTTYTPAAQDAGRTVTMTLIATRVDGVCQGRKDTVYQTIVYRPAYVRASVQSATRDTVCYFSNPGTLTASAATGGTGPFAYQWQSKQRGSSLWSNIVGATSLTYNTGSQQFLTDSCFRILTTDLGTPSCATSDPSAEYCIYVLPSLQAPRYADTTTICAGTFARLEPSIATGGNGCFTYTWQTILPTDPSIALNPSQSNLWNWTNLSGYTNQVSTVCTTQTFAFNGDLLIYRIVATDCELRASRPSCGSVWSLPIVVRARDITAPYIYPKTLTLYANSNCTANAPAATKANLDSASTDSTYCGGPLSNWTITPSVFTGARNHTAVVTAQDASGNIGSATTTVVVLDTTKPVARTKNITVYLNSNGWAKILPTDVNDGSSDNCTPAASLNMSVSIDSFYCSQTASPVNVTLTVRDASGNSHSAIAVVTVRDTLKPVINNMPGNVTLTGNGFQCAATYVWTVPTASDNCGISAFTSSHTPDSCFLFPQGVTTVTYTAVDPSGNTTVRSFTVTVNNCQGAAVSLNTNSSNCVDSSLTVDVNLNNYVGSLGALSLTITYPPSHMSFASIDSVLPGFIPGSVISNAVNGRLRLAWSSTDSIKICGGSSTLLRLRFNTLGVFGVSSLGFDLSIPENNELATGLAVVIPSTYAGVSTTLNPCLGIIGQVTYPKSPAVPLNNVDVIVSSDATYRFDSVAFNTVATSGATNLTVSDDQTITGIPMGFSFNYFGNTYDSINICSNGWVSFTETRSPFTVNFGGSVNNAIHGVMMDLYPIPGYFIRYSTLGSAPNRQFIVDYHMGYYACASNATLFTDFQIVLNENGTIALNTIAHPGCSNRPAIQGISSLAANNNDRIRVYTPGRNGTNWSGVSNSSYLLNYIPAANFTGRTNSNGNYYISGRNLSLGSAYKVSMNIPIDDNGFNSTDALIVEKYDIGAQTISGCSLIAGDVNGLSGINGIDAGLIKSNFSNPTLNFAKGPWVVCDTVLTYNAPLTTKNLSAVVTGDVDLSKTIFTPIPRYSYLTLENQGSVSKDKEGFVIPVYLNQNVVLGAASIVFTLPEGLRISDVKFADSNSETWTWKQVNNTLRLAWSSINGISSESNTPLFTIHSMNMVNGAIGLIAEETEFANPMAEVISGLQLRLPNLNSVNKLVSVYPNPSNGIFTIHGSVERYEVFDASGRLVLSDVANGSNVNLDMRNHAEGVYQVHVQTPKGLEVTRLVLRK